MGNPALKLPDGMHPSREGVALMVERSLPLVSEWIKGLR